jgi:hypothetical protein
MKRSKTIQLVLITAGLSSCYQGIQPQPANNDDWQYINRCPYPYLGQAYDSTTLYRQTLPFDFYINWFYEGRPNITNQAVTILKGPVVRHNQFVMRGGFGGHGFASC